jgi:hypothetical protein
MNFSNGYDIYLNSILVKSATKQCVVKVRYFLNSHVCD